MERVRFRGDAARRMERRRTRDEERGGDRFVKTVAVQCITCVLIFLTVFGMKFLTPAGAERVRWAVTYTIDYNVAASEVKTLYTAIKEEIVRYAAAIKNQ